jgi:hypothetical protein
VCRQRTDAQHTHRRRTAGGCKACFHIKYMRGLLRVLLAQPCLVLASAPHWPRVGIHDGNNRIVWSKGCCDGDLVIIDFRDEQGDGNQGSGLLRLSNHSSGAVATYEIAPFWGLWKTFGPFCAPHGEHSMTFTSDAQESETSFTILDSYGLVKARGGMNDFPVTFNVSAPSRFCSDPHLLTEERSKERARKVIAYDLQFTPRAELQRTGWIEDCPYDNGYTVLPPPKS